MEIYYNGIRVLIINEVTDSMKQHITIDDIKELTQSQMDQLSNLWIPQQYDTAVAVLCKNAATEEMDYIEFVVGKVNVDTDTRGNCHITLEDLSKSALIQAQTSEDETDESILDTEESAENEDAYSDEEYDPQLYEDLEFEDNEDAIDEQDPDYYENNYFVPDIFTISECLPLLSIGQMIEILHKNGFSREGVFISMYENESYLDRDGRGDGEFSNQELCDALWEAVKRML